MKKLKSAATLLLTLLLLLTLGGCRSSKKAGGDSADGSSSYLSNIWNESSQAEESSSNGEPGGTAGTSTASGSKKPSSGAANPSGGSAPSNNQQQGNGSGDENSVTKSTDYAGAQAIGAYTAGSEKMTMGFYVSPSGSDQGNGSLNNPFKTIQRAQQAIRSYLSSNKAPSGGIAVWLRAGTYQLSDSLNFTSADSGTSSECPVVYTAYKGEEVHISANKIIDSAYIKKTDSSWKYWNLVPASVRDKLYQVNLLDAVDIGGNRIFTSNWDANKSSLFQDNKPVFWMYQDNVPMTLARYPDIKDNDRYATASWDTVLKANGTSFKPSNASLDSWDASQEIYIHSPFSWMNNDFITRVSSVKSGFISLVSNPGGLGISDPDNGANPDNVRPYYAMNVVSELTQPGEYYFDGSNSTVYFLAYSNKSGYNLSVTPYSYSYALNIKNAKNIEFRNIYFEGGDDAVINIEGCSGIILRNCTVRNGVGQGINVNGTNITVDYCDIYNLGFAGVTLNGGNRQTLTKSGNTVSNSHIHNYAMFKMNGNAGVTMVSKQSCGHTIINNVINYAPQQAIYMGGNEITIENNEIYDICRLTDDAGAIYGARDWSFRGIRILNNIIHDFIPTVAGRPGAGAYGIYLDDCLSGVTVKGNIVYNGTSAGIMNNGGRDNKIENNVIVNCWRGLRSSQVGASSGGVNNKGGDSWNLLEKLNSVGYQSAIWSAAYPECAAIPNDYDQLRPYKKGTSVRVASEWLKPENCTFKANLGQGSFEKGWIVCDSSGASLKYYDGMSDKNISNAGTDLLKITGTSIFINFGDARLSAIGFQKIPVESIGITVK